MLNKIYVRNSGDGVGVIGTISGESGMVVDFHNNITGITIQSVSQDIVTASGQGISNRTDYAFHTYIKEDNATGYGWPTGTTSYKFN